MISISQAGRRRMQFEPDKDSPEYERLRFPAALMAVGWFAREDKISINRESNRWSVRLND